MAYTSDEKNAAVLRIVQGNPRFKRSSLATRRVDATSDEVSELIRTALFYEPDAVYYLAYLSSNYYTRTVKTTQSAVVELLDAIDDLLMPDRPIEDVSSISEARRALQSMETALSANGIVSSRGFTRYNAAITKSRDEIGNAVRLSTVSLGGGGSTTDVVRPRSQARSDANSGLKTLKSLHASILTAVDLMLRAHDIYVSSGISTAVARTQIARAKSDLEDLEDELGALTASQRVLRARDALLRIVANKGLVKAIAESPAPGEPKVSGPVYRASAYGSGTAPYVEGTISAPWPLTSTARIVEVDVGGTVASVDVATAPNGLSTTASLLSGNFEDFKIGPTEDPYPISTRRIATGGTFAVAGQTLYFIVDGVLYEVGFVGNRTAAQLAGDINGAIPVVTATAVTSGGQDHVDIAYNNGLPPTLSQNRYMRVASGVNNATGLAPWYVEGPAPVGTAFGEYSKGCDATDELRVQVNDDTSYTTINLTQGDWPDYLRTAAEVAADISGTGFTASDDGGRVRISSTVQGDGSRIKLLADGVSSETTSHRTLRVLGFSQNDESRGESSVGRIVQNVLNEDATFSSIATATARRDTLLTARNAVVTGLSQLSISLDADPTGGWVASQLKVTISNGANRGAYGVSSVTWTAPNLVLNLTRQLTDQSATNKHSVSVLKELLRLTSKSADTGAYVDVAAPANSAHAVLGLSTTRVYGTVEQLLVEYNDPVLGWIPADLTRSKIDVGDVVLNDATAVATVTGVSGLAVGVLDVTPISPSTSISSLYVMSGDAQLHEAFITALTAWSDGLSPFNDEELAAVDKVLAPVLILQNPSRDQLAAAYAVVEAYGTKLSDLKTVLDSYVVPSIAVVDDALRTMEEHGQDRARVLLLEGRFDSFFGTTARTASYSRAMMDAASRLTVNDLNEPTMTRGEEEKIFQRVTAFWEEDVNPSLSVESEEPFPASPLINFWPEER